MLFKIALHSNSFTVYQEGVRIQYFHSTTVQCTSSCQLTTACAGIQFGSMIVLGCSGLIADSLGWPVIFYASGVIGLCWVALWMTLGGNSPEAHTFISLRERLFVQRSLPTTARDNVVSTAIIFHTNTMNEEMFCLSKLCITTFLFTILSILLLKITNRLKVLK